MSYIYLFFLDLKQQIQVFERERVGEADKMQGSRKSSLRIVDSNKMINANSTPPLKSKLNQAYSRTRDFTLSCLHKHKTRD